MKASPHFDVIIVGGGPAGSACATLLARAGIATAICERAKFPRDKICGDCVNPASWELLEMIGVSSKLRAINLSQIDGIRITGSTGTELAVALNNEPARPFFAIKRRVLDALLQYNAAGAGAVVFEQTQVMDLYWKGKWCVVTRGNHANANRVLTSDFLIGADGRNSLVAQKLGRHGLRRPGGGNIPTRVGIQWHTQYQPQIGSMIELILFESGYCGIVNVDDDQANIAMVTDSKRAMLAKRNFKQFLHATLLGNASAVRRLQTISPVGKIATAFPIDPIVNALQHQSAILIGDARCTVEPFTGQGILFALQEGVRTAGALIASAHSHAESAELSFPSRFWVNRVYSPILQHKILAEKLLSLGARFPRLIPWALQTVFPPAHPVGDAI